MLTASSIGRVTGDLDVLDRQPRRLRNDDDPRKGHLRIDAAGHLPHEHQAEDRQQTTVNTIKPKYGLAQATRLTPRAACAPESLAGVEFMGSRFQSSRAFPRAGCSRPRR